MAGGGVAMAEGVLTNGRGGRFSGTDNLTDKQRKFVRRIVRNGGNATAAARDAGYSRNRADTAAWELSQNPRIQRAIFEERQRYISGELANIAAGTMQQLMTDESTPAATRYQAAKWCLEQAGHKNDDVKALIDNGKSLNDMTIEELQAFINAGGAALQALETQRQRIIDVTPTREPESGDSAQRSAQPDDVTDVLD